MDISLLLEPKNQRAQLQVGTLPCSLACFSAGERRSCSICMESQTVLGLVLLLVDDDDDDDGYLHFL